MEGDCKFFYDVVIDTLVFDSKLLSLEFNSCCFCWVRREANNVAYTLAKFATHQSLAFCCNKNSLTPSVLEACLSDVLCESFLMKSSFSKKKKKSIQWSLFSFQHKFFFKNWLLLSQKFGGKVITKLTNLLWKS
jgi:hypothetical protein